MLCMRFHEIWISTVIIFSFLGKVVTSWVWNWEPLGFNGCLYPAARDASRFKLKCSLIMASYFPGLEIVQTAVYFEVKLFAIPCIQLFRLTQHFFLTGCWCLSFRSQLKDSHYVSTGFAWFMCLFYGFTIFQGVVRLRGFFFGSITIWWRFWCFCLLSSSRYSGTSEGLIQILSLIFPFVPLVFFACEHAFVLFVCFYRCFTEFIFAFSQSFLTLHLVQPWQFSWP